MLRFAEALLDDGRGVVGPETLASMLSPHVHVDPRLPGRGLGFHLGTYGTHAVAGHDGAVPGFVSTLLFAPGTGCAAVAMANASSLSIGAGVHRVAADLLRHVLGVPDPTEALPATGVPEHPELWPEVGGLYVPEPGLLTSVRSWWLGAAYLVRPGRGHLTLRTAVGGRRGPARLYPVDADDPLRFRIVGRAGLVSDVAFQRGADGRVTHLCIASPMGSFLRLRRARRGD
jgi:hypothetical protein